MNAEKLLIGLGIHMEPEYPFCYSLKLFIRSFTARILYGWQQTFNWREELGNSYAVTIICNVLVKVMFKLQAGYLNEDLNLANPKR